MKRKVIQCPICETEIELKGLKIGPRELVIVVVQDTDGSFIATSHFSRLRDGVVDVIKKISPTAEVLVVVNRDEQSFSLETVSLLMAREILERVIEKAEKRNASLDSSDGSDGSGSSDIVDNPDISSDTDSTSLLPHDSSNE